MDNSAVKKRLLGFIPMPWSFSLVNGVEAVETGDVCLVRSESLNKADLINLKRLQNKNAHTLNGSLKYVHFILNS